MKRLLLVIPLMVAGCGSGVGGQSLRTQQACFYLTPNALESLVILVETLRDEGLSKAALLNETVPGCRSAVAVTPADCLHCMAVLTDEVYP